MGAPDEEPTTAVMRVSYAAAMRLCFPLRECPKMPMLCVSRLAPRGGDSLTFWLGLSDAPWDLCVQKRSRIN